jgi:hypothetical protein
MTTDMNRTRPTPRRSGLNLIDPDAVAARAWVPPTAPHRGVAPAEPGRPVLPGQAIAFRAGPNARPDVLTPIVDGAWTAPTRAERRRSAKRRITARLVVIATLGAMTVLAAVAFVVR